jgi:hypothetical protein
MHPPDFWHQRPCNRFDPAKPHLKTGGHCKPAKLTCFFLIKTRISSNNSSIAIFSIGVDALPLEPKNWIVRLANGGCFGLQIDPVPFIWICSLHARIHFCQTFFRTPCQGKYSRSFRSNRALQTPKRNPNWAYPGIGGWIMPGFGV